MRYEVYGPFQPPRILTADTKKNFWCDVDQAKNGLSKAIGIYVFSTVYGEKYTPWYVGKTNAKKGFHGEIFQDHKLRHYIDAQEYKRGRPAVHLIAKVQLVRGNFCKQSKRSGDEIDELETFMIGMAIRVNSRVKNSKKTFFNRNCQVPGIIGNVPKGRPTDSAKSLSKVFNI